MKAFAIVGNNSKKVHHDGQKFLIYFDGFLAEEKMYELKGRGLQVDVKEVTVHIKRDSLTPPIK